MRSFLLLTLALLLPQHAYPASGAGKVDVPGYLQFKDGSAPASPSAGYRRIYTKSADRKLYTKDGTTGTETKIPLSGDVSTDDMVANAITNAKMATMAESRAKCRASGSGTGDPQDCTEEQIQKIVGLVPQLLSHQSTPSNPSAGSAKLYIKSDNRAYILDSSGTESEVGSGATQPTVIVAGSGGSVTTSGDWKIHTFTSSGIMQISTAPSGAKVDIVAVGGGGGGGGYLSCNGGGGGGGGGAVIQAQSVPVQYGDYTVTIGSGGSSAAGSSANGGTGGTSSFASLVSALGGAGGAGEIVSGQAGISGAKGGGAGGCSGACGSARAGGAATSVSGNSGGGYSAGVSCAGGGGGGGSAGSNAPSTSNGGAGGAGTDISTVCGGALAGTIYGGGGGGGGFSVGGAGGNGGGGAGGGGSAGSAGTANTGGGGGGAGNSAGSGAGGTGIVIVCYIYQ